MQLQNFKACRSVDLELAPLTVLIGANNAGKSSVLHSIALEAQSVTPNVLTVSGSLVDLGRTLDSVVHRLARGRAGAPADIGLVWSDSGSPRTHVELDLRIDSGGDCWSKLRLTLPLPGGGSASFDAGPDSISVTSVAGDRPQTQQVPVGRGSWWSFPPGDAPDLTVGTRRAVHEAAPYLQQFVGASLRLFRYVGVNRHIESSVFPLGSQPVVNPRTAQELVDTLAYDDELLELVSTRCEAIFGYGVDKDLIPGQQITVVAKSPSGPRNVVNLGTGFIQTVWLLTQLELAIAQPPTQPWQITPLVGIEEPELHIHPGLQPDIARLLGAFVKAGVDLICTTQSEHLLLALLSLVLEGELSADQIIVYYLREGAAEKLTVDEQGRIEGGLRGFFEANEEQLRRHIELLKQRG
jgi:hypothetical protein